MTTKDFNSSQLKRGEYSYADNSLIITFTNDKKYEYKEVPPEKWEGLCSAESAGKYFNAEIKNSFKYFKHG